MGFTSAPWAIDGARTPSSVARLAERASVKQSGIVNVGDLKVLQLAVPGDGVRISVGGAVLENRYTASSNQAYVVEATSEEILDSTDNFSGIIGNGAAQSHLICVTIGDPNYSASGHPWMTTAIQDDLIANPATALDFQYVRPWVIKNVPAGTTRIEDLGAPPTYPCYALARIDVPAGSGSITSAMIVDLRQVVNPRSLMAQINVPTADADVLSVATAYTYETWPDASSFSAYVPPWATKVYVQAWIYGFKQGSDGLIDAPMRAELRKSDGTFVAATAGTVFYDDATTGKAGWNKQVLIAGPISIPSAQRGTTCKFSTAATVANTATMNTKLATTSRTSVSITLRFVEEAV